MLFWKIRKYVDFKFYRGCITRLFRIDNYRFCCFFFLLQFQKKQADGHIKILIFFFLETLNRHWTLIASRHCWKPLTFSQCFTFLLNRHFMFRQFETQTQNASEPYCRVIPTKLKTIASFALLDISCTPICSLPSYPISTILFLHIMFLREDIIL